MRSPVDVGGTPTAVTVSAGTVWVADQAGGKVVRVDPRRRRRIGRPVAVGDAPVAIAGGTGAVWVAGGDGTVRSLEARSGRLEGRPVRLPGATGIAVDAGGVWVTDHDAGTVTRIDPATRRPDPPLRVGDGPADVVIAEGDVWVANGDAGTVSRIEPDTGAVAGPIETGGSRVLALASGEGAVWAAIATSPFGDRIEVVRIDPATGELDERAVPVMGATPLDLAAGEGGVWATDVGGVRPPGPKLVEGTVTRIDPGEAAVVGKPLPVGDRPTAVAVGEGGVWVANAADGTLTPITLAAGR
ncbi:MAG: hypothetical protein WKF94_00430 [Solirubrobacteraceae bacterium]